jgi:hypothetical protein
MSSLEAGDQVLRAGDPDVAEAFIEDLTREMDALRAGTYSARDPAGLATATVDGDGLVVDVRFPQTVGRHQEAAVEEAVRLAVAAAQQRLAEAYDELARVSQTWPDGVPHDDFRDE